MKKPTQKELLARYRRALVKLDAMTSAQEIERDGRPMLTMAPKTVDASMVWMIAHFALDDLDPQQAVLDCLEQDLLTASIRIRTGQKVDDDTLWGEAERHTAYQDWETKADDVIAQRAKMAENAASR